MEMGHIYIHIPGLRWVIGDGRRTKFWSDQWLLKGPILDSTTQELPGDIANLCVRDLWIDGAGWDWTRITPFVSRFVRLNLGAVVVDTVTGAVDRMAWGSTPDGRFSVKSAYEFQTEDTTPRPNMESVFGKVWKLTVPERVRVFLWLVVNQAIMTNNERQRRHLSDSGLCQVCKSGEETIMHVLRDCPAMEGIWNRIVPLSKRRLFFEQSLFEWIYGNIGDVSIRYEVPWGTIFGMAVWWGWKWRCGNVFGENKKCRDRVQFVKDLAKEVCHSSSLGSGGSIAAPRVERLIAWLPPRVGCFKLNTDGASRGNPGLATAGGVIRDGEGGWIQGFSLNIGFCSAPLAELWGVYYGLFLAWDRGIRDLELEVDSEMVVGFLKTGISDTHPLSFLARLCYGFLSKDWSVRISHVYREANRLADGLANYAFSRPLGLHLLEACPEVCRSLLFEDANGSVYPRSIRL